MSRRRGGAGTVALARVALLAAVGGACGRDRAAPADSAKVHASVPRAATGVATPGQGPDCPRTGHWTVCQVRYRIDRAGLTPHDTTAPVDLPALGPSPSAYRIGKAVLVVYLFGDSASRSRAGRQLDTTKFVADTMEMTILSQATVIQNDNLLALLFSKNDHQRERASDALTAGPPQP